MKRWLSCACAISLALSIISPAHAQLLSDRTADNRRECVYVGADQLDNGQVVPRVTVVPASQPCPDIAPYRDPNRRAPGNAALVREVPTNGRRECVYAQGGVEYSRVVPVRQRCAMTPDLLDRAIAASDPGTLGR